MLKIVGMENAFGTAQTNKEPFVKSKQISGKHKYTMRKKLPKTLGLLIFSIYLLDFSLKIISQAVKN